MASVLLVYAMRKVLSVYALKAYALAAALSAIVFTVSVPHILSNMMHAGLLNTGSFLFAAFVETSLTVQTMSIAAFIFGALLLRDSFVSKEQGIA